jgi:V/A-type H+/Na+-transporting ATPase subunit E
MKSEDSNIETLTQEVLREAQSDADQVLAKAMEKSEDIRQSAFQQAEASRAQILEQANREAQRIHCEAISTAQLKARTLQLEQREKLLDEVFDAAQQQLPSIPQGTDYEQIACRLLREALSQLGSEQAVIHADEKTGKYLTKEVVKRISKELGVKAQLGNTLEHGIGVIAETADSHRKFDNTLETRLARFRDTLRLSVYHLLEGESL